MLERLKRPLYWKNFVKREKRYDLSGQYLGEFPSYGETQYIRANISVVTGAAEQELFGNLLEYDRIIKVRYDVDIDENSLVWLDGVEPPAAHNYIVKKKAVSGNYTLLGLQRVEVK